MGVLMGFDWGVLGGIGGALRVLVGSWGGMRDFGGGVGGVNWGLGGGLRGGGALIALWGVNGVLGGGLGWGGICEWGWFFGGDVK